jgi:hypothetical protein
MLLKQSFEQPAPVKVLINIGGLLDIPTGFFVEGSHGEQVLLGGLGAVTAIVGRGNRYKSTIMHYMLLSAMDRLISTIETSAGTYDTEINIHEHALTRFTERFENLLDKDIINDGIWSITDKTQYYGNKWYEVLKEFLKHKEDNRNKLMATTPFMDREKNQNIKLMIPTFSEIDSFSEFETEDVAKMQDENELGESGGNTIHMRQGLAKTRFMMEVPTLFGKVNHFLLMTAHLGETVQVAAGPYAPQPVKKLQYMKAGETIKGVTSKFFFLMNNCWHAINASPLTNQSTKGPEYPKDSKDTEGGDLNVVTLQQLRGKSGPTGFTLDIIVSQTEGVLPSLSEFHYIKDMDRFGLSGTLQSYSLDLYPDVKLSRTTIRNKIDTDAKLRRALNITSELCQMQQYYRGIRDELCTPKELYDSLKSKGYDWDVILSSTRGWWAFEEAKHPLKFLSTMDLINIKNGKYEPYWINELKEIKK